MHVGLMVSEHDERPIKDCLEAVCLHTPHDLDQHLRDPLGALVLAQEKLDGPTCNVLLAHFKSCPIWSDLPLLVICHSPDHMCGQEILDRLLPHTNVMLVQRPLDLKTLSSTVRVALRSRERQYQVRDVLEEMALALKQRDEFISIAGHELKTPLSSLKLQNQMDKRALNRGDCQFSSERLGKLIDGTGRQVDRLTKLIEDMLDLSRIRLGKLSLKRAEVDLVELVRQVVEQYSTDVEHAGCRVHFHAQQDVVGHWDRYRLEQVVVNLLTNAIKYGRGGEINIHVRQEGGWAQLEIRDQGIGISPENHKRVFERFERATNDQTVNGLGLGLFIVRQILELHGGSIHLQSALGKGAVFVAKLPLACPTQATL